MMVVLYSTGLNILRYVYAKSNGCQEPQYIDCWNQPSTVPECLQTFKWSGYEGTPEQRDFVVSRRLKIATISSEESEVPKLQMIQELSLSFRASAVCRLAFD